MSSENESKYKHIGKWLRVLEEKNTWISISVIQYGKLRELNAADDADAADASVQRICLLLFEFHANLISVIRLSAEFGPWKG